jgi:hypothetical protein
MEKDYYLKKVESLKTLGNKTFFVTARDMTDLGSSSVFIYPMRTYLGEEIDQSLYSNFFTGKNKPKIERYDIMSPKVKAVLSFESPRPLEDKIYAIDSGAMSRREAAEYDAIKNYTIKQIMGPIDQMIAMEIGKQSGQIQTEEDAAALKQQMDELYKSLTPDDIKTYKLQNQDIADIAGNDVLKFLKERCKLKNKFDEGLKYGLVTRTEAYRMYEHNGHPDIYRVENVIYSKSNTSDFIEDSIALCATYCWDKFAINKYINFRDNEDLYEKLLEGSDEEYGITEFSVEHYMWRDLKDAKRIEVAEGEYKVVDADYKATKEEEVENVQVEVIHFAWKINDFIVDYGEYIVGDNTEDLKMPYYGKEYEDWFFRRLFKFQILYDIMWYHKLRFIAKLKGSKTAINFSAIPTSSGIDVAKFIEHMDKDDLIFLNPKEEGNRNEGSPLGNFVKEINLNHHGDVAAIQKILDYIDYKAGEIVGVPKQIEAQIQEREGARNVSAIYGQALKMLEPYYSTHDEIKDRVMLGLIDFARRLYKKSKPESLYYTLDDNSLAWIKFNNTHFSMSTYGFFKQNTASVFERKSKIEAFIQMAAQSGNMRGSTALSIINTNNPKEAEIALKVAEQEADARAMAAAQKEHDNSIMIEKEKQKTANELFERQKELVILKEKENRITQIQKAAIVALGFAKEQDANNNGQPDVIEQMNILLKAKEVEIQDRLANAKIGENKNNA